MELGMHNAAGPSASSGGNVSKPRESLATMAAKWRKIMADVACGPLRIAWELRPICEDWETTWRAEAGDLDCNDWLLRTFGCGMGLAYWRRRWLAVEKLGEAVRRSVHHEVAVWVAHNTPLEARDEIMDLLYVGYQTNHETPLSLQQARLAISRLLDKQPKSRGADYKSRAQLLARIEQLEGVLLDWGIELPPWPTEPR